MNEKRRGGKFAGLFVALGMLTGACNGVVAGEALKNNQSTGQARPGQVLVDSNQERDNSAMVSKMENGYLFCPDGNLIGEEILATESGKEVVVFKANWTNGNLPTFGDGDSSGINETVVSHSVAFDVSQDMGTTDGNRGCLKLTHK